MTGPRSDREITMSLRVLTLPVRPDGLSSVACLNCRKPVDIHQPDSDLPDRMLATCPSCQSWHLIDCADSSENVVIVLLPDCSSWRGVRPAERPAPKSRPRRGAGPPR